MSSTTDIVTILGPWQLYGSVAWPGSHPGGGDSGLVAGGQDPEGLGRGSLKNGILILHSNIMSAKRTILH